MPKPEPFSEDSSSFPIDVLAQGLSALAHAVKNPLNVVSSDLSYLESLAPDDEEFAARRKLQEVGLLLGRASSVLRNSESVLTDNLKGNAFDGFSSDEITIVTLLGRELDESFKGVPIFVDRVTEGKSAVYMTLRGIPSSEDFTGTLTDYFLRKLGEDQFGYAFIDLLLYSKKAQSFLEVRGETLTISLMFSTNEKE